MNFRQHIQVTYPPHNFNIFEEWFSENYKGCDTDRELLPIWFTSFYVNNNYGNDEHSKKELQYYLNGFDKTKKYFSIVQYDDSILNDVSHLDVLRFEMSKSFGVGLPLMCEPHPFKFETHKQYIANFIGSRTHPVRDSADLLRKIDGHFISFDHFDIEPYCRVIHESLFTLCYRGYGINSFRVAEALQFGSIPVYISDDFVHPFDLKFYDYGICINSRHAHLIEQILSEISPQEIIERQRKCKEIYEKYYTYQGCFDNIIRTLETEHYTRKSCRTKATADEATGFGGAFRF